MRKYPFDPDVLDSLPEGLAELFRGLEETLLKDICERLAVSDALNEASLQDIRALRSHGIALETIEQAIADTASLSVTELDSLIADIVELNETYYGELFEAVNDTRNAFNKLTIPEVLVDAEDIQSILIQTKGEVSNITQSMGFLVDNGRTKLAPAKAYQWALDSAELQVQSGAISYNQAIYRAVKELADSGLKTVDYESGHIDQVDVAVRRAVLTGIGQLNSQYAINAMEFLDTDVVEVSAHAGARNVDGPNGWENHERWQGKCYRWPNAMNYFRERKEYGQHKKSV